MYKHLLSFTIRLLFFSAILFGIHYYIFATFFESGVLYFPLWTIYLFHVTSVLGVFGLLYYKVTQGGQKSFQLFVMLTTIKMILAIVFLLPVIAGKAEHPVTDVSNFFIPYFLFLGFEIFSINEFFKTR